MDPAFDLKVAASDLLLGGAGVWGAIVGPTDDRSSQLSLGPPAIVSPWMIHRLSANTASDQNGAAGMSSNAPMAASDPTTIAKYRP